MACLFFLISSLLLSLGNTVVATVNSYIALDLIICRIVLDRVTNRKIQSRIGPGGPEAAVGECESHIQEV